MSTDQYPISSASARILENSQVSYSNSAFPTTSTVFLLLKLRIRPDLNVSSLPFRHGYSIPHSSLLSSSFQIMLAPLLGGCCWFFRSIFGKFVKLVVPKFVQNQLQTPKPSASIIFIYHFKKHVSAV